MFPIDFIIKMLSKYPVNNILMSKSIKNITRNIYYVLKYCNLYSHFKDFYILINAFRQGSGLEGFYCMYYVRGMA